MEQRVVRVFKGKEAQIVLEDYKEFIKEARLEGKTIGIVRQMLIFRKSVDINYGALRKFINKHETLKRVWE